MGSRRSLEWPPWAQGSYRIRAGSLALSSDEFRVGRLAPSVGVHRNSNAWGDWVAPHGGFIRTQYFRGANLIA